MRPSPFAHWAVPVVLAFTGPAVADSGSSPNQICIHLYDYAGVPEREMTRAQNVTDELFARAGLATRWIRFRADRDTGVRAVSRTAGCATGARLGSRDLVLSVYPRSMAQAFRLSPRDFGFAALPSKSGEFGVRANVFLERLTLLAQVSNGSRAVYLGHAIAHEIGHLLLGEGSHSASGIMRAPWRRREMHLAATGALIFTAAEARRMRRQVETRIRAGMGGASKRFAAARSAQTRGGT